MESHTKERHYFCSVCNKLFTYKLHLAVHMRSHKGKIPYSCSVCNKTFTRKCILLCHMRIHTGERPYLCSVCNKTFRRKDVLLRHMRMHTWERPYSCSVCNKTFRGKSGLLYHTRIHRGEKPYSCSLCKKTFVDKGGLLCHMRIHTGEKPFSCSVCNKLFRLSTGLLHHMRIHTGERPYSCSVCNKTFREKRHLLCHMRIHTGERPYSCSLCNKTFAVHSTSWSHMRVHTKEKRYSCSKCNETYAWKYSLAYHMRTHTACSKKKPGQGGKDPVQPANNAQIPAIAKKSKLSFIERLESRKSAYQLARTLPTTSDVLTKITPHTTHTFIVHPDGRQSLLPSAKEPDPNNSLLEAVPTDASLCQYRGKCGQIGNSAGNRLLKFKRKCKDQTGLPRHIMSQDVTPPVVHERDVYYQSFDDADTMKSQTSRHVPILSPSIINEQMNPTCLQDRISSDKQIFHTLSNDWDAIRSRKNLDNHNAQKSQGCQLRITRHGGSPNSVQFSRLPVTGTQHKCLVCDKVFACQIHMYKHLKTHANEKAFECDICGKKFYNTMSRNTHRKLHFIPSVYKQSNTSQTLPQNQGSQEDGMLLMPHETAPEQTAPEQAASEQQYVTKKTQQISQREYQMASGQQQMLCGKQELVLCQEQMPEAEHQMLQINQTTQQAQLQAEQHVLHSHQQMLHVKQEILPCYEQMEEADQQILPVKQEVQAPEELLQPKQEIMQEQQE